MLSDDSSGAGWLRQAIDLIVCFVVAVILLRGFVLEGYLISTGSMAPGLRGFHKRVVCPSCRYPFAFGVSFDESVTGDGTSLLVEDGANKYATCPNCGQINIDVSDVPTSHGDQLLVQKHLFDFRPPRRWEAVVFRNPASPGEAYVKRVVGLPGESIQVVGGEVFINGQLVRKDYAAQVESRIAVSDLAFTVDSANWEQSWQFGDAWQFREGPPVTGMSHSDEPAARPVISASLPGSSANLSNGADAQFRYWRWYGGSHVSETPLTRSHAEPDWSQFLKRFDRVPVSWASRVEFDAENELLRCEGVMPPEMQRDLMSQASREEFRNAVYRLAALSHLAPVTDRYGYNAMVASPEYPVSDLMLHMALSWKTPPETVRVSVPLESDVYEVELNPAIGTVSLLAAGHSTPLRQAELSVPQASRTKDGNGRGEGRADSVDDSTLILEVSNIDHQIVVAVNGQPCFAPVEKPFSLAEYAEPRRSVAPSTVPSAAANSKERQSRIARSALLKERQERWRFSIDGDGVRLDELKVYRDVFYTPGRRLNAIEAPYQIPGACYFVLGDNSPVSSDSRNWLEPVVPHRMLIGKPFLVHLPSRPAVLEFGRFRWQIRIPDWPRIRYIH